MPREWTRSEIEAYKDWLSVNPAEALQHRMRRDAAIKLQQEKAEKAEKGEKND